MFDLSNYNVRQLDPQQGTKPLDFGGGGITGSVNLDGRLIAINTYHPEHGYITLTSIPPFPDEDRYDQKKVRAYRESLVANEGFGLQFEQDIVKREYYLIEDAIPFIRFTLEDGTIAECMTVSDKTYVKQIWRVSKKIQVSARGTVWLMRAAYTQLTEGGIIPMPSSETWAGENNENMCLFFNDALKRYAFIKGFDGAGETGNDNAIFDDVINIDTEFEIIMGFATRKGEIIEQTSRNLSEIIQDIKEKFPLTESLVLNRAFLYSDFCLLNTTSYIMDTGCILTDHMLLPLSWNRDSYYISQILNKIDDLWNVERYINWLLYEAWRGTFNKYFGIANNQAWARSYLANGVQKDSSAYQLDQQLYPILTILDFAELENDAKRRQNFLPHLKDMLHSLFKFTNNHLTFPTDETPADDEIPLHTHFSSHILLWYVYKRLAKLYSGDDLVYDIEDMETVFRENILKLFVTNHKGKQIFSYATGRKNEHYFYHDANDIPLVMMPLWGFCDKDDLIWRNTIDFAFSNDNPGFYDGVLGSVHTPAPWSLGDAQELILSKVIGDRERYQRVWERVEKAAQWDGALPEAYDARTFEVVSRHWFAWTNAMVAIADGISWDWETEGEYAR